MLPLIGLVDAESQIELSHRAHYWNTKKSILRFLQHIGLQFCKDHRVKQCCGMELNGCILSVILKHTLLFCSPRLLQQIAQEWDEWPPPTARQVRCYRPAH
jgi:hypothetical protein